MESQDLIPSLLSKFNSLTLNTVEWRETKNKIIEELKKQNAFFYDTHHTTFPVNRVGSSFEFNVPENKKGYLKPYRGKKVRAICLYSKKFIRHFAIQDLTNF